VFAYRFGCRLDGNAVGMPIGEGVHDRRQV
jgi:hypothetical protein